MRITRLLTFGWVFLCFQLGQISQEKFALARACDTSGLSAQKHLNIVLPPYQ